MSLTANHKHIGKVCPRCANRIKSGEEVEAISVENGVSYAHANCKPVKRRRRSKPKNPTADDVKTMPSRFANSVCKKCSKPIGFGEMITNAEIEQYGWIHASCASSTPAKEPKPASKAAATPANASDGIVSVDSTLFQKLIRQLSKAGETIVKLNDRIAAVESQQARTVEVRTPDGERNKVDCVHPIFDRVLQLASMRKNILIPGPTGCGKTHLAKQVAEALGLPFGFVSCSVGMSEGQLTGRLLPVGDGGRFEFVTSEFLTCYENGGVFLLDEMDAADANVLLVINAALANGVVPVPNRPDRPYAVKHEDFVLIAGTNTDGSGADRRYSGRNQLDDATLDRFRIGQVSMGYDHTIEAALLGAKVKASKAKRASKVEPATPQQIFDTLRGYRERIDSNRLERAISTRFMLDARDMAVGCDWTMADIETALFSGWREDEVAKVKGV